MSKGSSKYIFQKKDLNNVNSVIFSQCFVILIMLNTNIFVSYLSFFHNKIIQHEKISFLHNDSLSSVYLLS